MGSKKVNAYGVILFRDRMWFTLDPYPVKPCNEFGNPFSIKGTDAWLVADVDTHTGQHLVFLPYGSYAYIPYPTNQLITIEEREDNEFSDLDGIEDYLYYGQDKLTYFNGEN